MPIKVKHILAQLKADLIGKDSHRGITLTYAWLANQFGHFALGFIPVILLNALFCSRQSANPAFLAFVIVSGFWLLFEIYNFLGPLIRNRRSRRHPFPPPWRNVAFDTATDMLFFWLGTLAAWLFLEYDTQKLLALGALILILLYPMYYWYTTKLIQQSAQYPFQFRLSQWFFNISTEGQHTVLNFLKAHGNRHLLVFGPRGSGKTHIAVGIANELSIRRNSCFYTPAIKLFGLFFNEPDEAPIWSWHNTGVLVIDDINPGDPIQQELVTPEQFLQYIDAQTGSSNRKILREKAVIWVLGNGGDNGSRAHLWSTMLAQIGVAPGNIMTLDLSQGRI